MRSAHSPRLVAGLLALAVVVAGLPGVGLAVDDNDNASLADESNKAADLKIEYLGWDPKEPTLIRFKVSNVGNAPSTATTGKGETLAPPPSQETAPPIPALAPGASFQIPYAVYPAEACANHRVRMSVPLVNDRNPKDNTLEVQLCRKDQEPDLKLEYLGGVVGNDQLITFKVTNVGGAPSAATTGRVETIAPLPAQETAPPIPALAPGGSFEFPYALFGTGGCDNHTIKASVPLAQDFYPTNNTLQIQICGPKPPPPSPLDDVVVGPAPHQIPVPEYLRKGAHFPVLEPSYVTSYFMDYFPEPGDCGPYPYGRPTLNPVGWFQVEDSQDIFGVKYRECAYVGEGQTAVTFDYGDLDDITPEWITGATLSFQERQLEWRDNGGKTGCVTNLDLATVDWTRPNVTYVPIPSRPYSAGPDNAVRFNVTDPVRRQLNNEQPRYGFVLRGVLGLYQLEGYGFSSCLSNVENIQLQISYDVP